MGKDLKITALKGTGHFKARGAQQPGKGMQQTFSLSRVVSLLTNGVTKGSALRTPGSFSSATSFKLELKAYV